MAAAANFGVRHRSSRCRENVSPPGKDNARIGRVRADRPSRLRDRKYPLVSMKVVLPDRPSSSFPTARPASTRRGRSGRGSPSRPCSCARTAPCRICACRSRTAQRIQILTTRDTDDPDALVRPAPLHRAPARGGGAPALPGRQGRDRPADRERLLLRLRVPGADPRGRTSSGSRRRSAGSSRRAASGRVRKSARGSEAALRRGGRAVQGRARRHRRRRDLPLHPGRLHRPLPRPAPAGLEADQGAEADGPRRRVLARRRDEAAADADLRHRVLPQEDLDAYLERLEEARKRDHRRLGPQLDLFHLDEHSPGSPFWHPKGMVIWNVLEDLRRRENAAAATSR